MTLARAWIMTPCQFDSMGCCFDFSTQMDENIVQVDMVTPLELSSKVDKMTHHHLLLRYSWVFPRRKKIRQEIIWIFQTLPSTRSWPKIFEYEKKQRRIHLLEQLPKIFHEKLLFSPRRGILGRAVEGKNIEKLSSSVEKCACVCVFLNEATKMRNPNQIQTMSYSILELNIFLKEKERSGT